VSRRRVLEAAFVLLEFSSPSRRIFIGSHSLPPSLVRRIGPSVIMARNSETLVLKPVAMTSPVFESVYASLEWCCGKEEHDLVQDGSDDA
jgi:hypothetical protein